MNIEIGLAVFNQNDFIAGVNNTLYVETSIRDCVISGLLI